MLKDFNIVDEAGGAGKILVRKFLADVSASTLEIRFYWAGKGTTAIPNRGVYGPLVSAISVNPSKILGLFQLWTILGYTILGFQLYKLMS